MSEALDILSRVSHLVRGLNINPWLVAVVLALGAAWIEQKLTQRDTPSFTADHRGEAARNPRQAPR
jgi:hypothetical protein